MASTTVAVFPVPGGPYNIYGESNDDLRIILNTASRCCALFAIFVLNHGKL